MPDGEQTPGEEVVASAIEGAVAKFSEQAVKSDPEPAVKSDPTKEKIPPKNIIEMLTNGTRRGELMPLLEDVLVKISNIDGLDESITNVIRTKGTQELTQALTTLQKKLRSIYTTGYTTTTGGKRRRTKKRKHYKKRRSTKHR